MPGSGNRRNPHAHAAILSATLRSLRTVTYQALTIESIATAAGVGKATVYRWWPSKGALVAEAISSALTVEDQPRTGDLRADLISAVEVSVQNYASVHGALLIAALAADLTDDADLLNAFVESFVVPRRAAVKKLIAQVSAVGLLPASSDPELIMDMWAGAVIYRCLMRHQPIDPEVAAKLVDNVIVQPAQARQR